MLSTFFDVNNITYAFIIDSKHSKKYQHIVKINAHIIINNQC